MRKGILLLLISLLLLSCRKDKTSWTSNWSLPLVNDTLDLSNQINDSTLSVNSEGNLEVELTRTVLDLGIEDILSLPDTTIEQVFTSSVGPLNVPPGFTIVNEIEEHTLDLEDIQLKKIRLTEGRIRFTVYNPVDTKCFFTVKLPGVIKDGSVLEQQFSVSGSSSAGPGSMNSLIDLAGYEMDLTGISGSLYNVLQSLLVVSSDPAGPFVTITQAQQFKIQATFENIRMDYARGYFGNRVFSDTVNVDLEALKNVISGTLDLPAPELFVDIINGVKIAARATILNLSNTSVSGNTVQLSGGQIQVPLYINEPTGNWSTLQPSQTSLEFNGANSNIEAYLENLGTVHQLAYQLELNPWGNLSGGYNEIYPNSRLKVKVRAMMPLELGADGLTLQDTFNLDFEQDIEKTHVGSGSFVLTALNAFPLAASVKLMLLDDNGQLLHIVNGTQDVLSANSGELDPLSGLLVEKSEVIFDLPAHVLNDLQKIKKVCVRAVFNTPDATGNSVPMSIKAGAYLAVKLKTRFVLNTVL
ncbi:MAG: hypothetical protein LW688_08605 [Cryomorphaceae bacterium]|nr:hypothetical protein [Cryomorphaceae bacterium]